jgi:hypothetical protein
LLLARQETDVLDGPEDPDRLDGITRWELRCYFDKEEEFLDNGMAGLTIFCIFATLL